VTRKNRADNSEHLLIGGSAQMHIKVILKNRKPSPL